MFDIIDERSNHKVHWSIVFRAIISFEIRSMWGIPNLNYIPTILRASRVAAAGFQFEYSKSLDKGVLYQSPSFSNWSPPYPRQRANGLWSLALGHRVNQLRPTHGEQQGSLLAGNWNPNKGGLINTSKRINLSPGNEFWNSAEQAFEMLEKLTLRNAVLTAYTICFKV